VSEYDKIPKLATLTVAAVFKAVETAYLQPHMGMPAQPYTLPGNACIQQLYTRTLAYTPAAVERDLVGTRSVPPVRNDCQQQARKNNFLHIFGP
jgi:hypothetical protein